MEEWKDITDYEKEYQISNLGRVRSKRNLNGSWVGRIKAQRLSNCGYSNVLLSKHQKHKVISVHRLVAQQFIPNPHNLPCTNHINGIKTDNRSENLEWCNHSENVLHAYKLGLAHPVQGEHNGQSKITEDQVREIREKYSPRKYTYKKLAEEYGLTKSTVREIVQRWIWKHI